jgi:uncharacterized protein (TIGR02996 family)
MTDDSFIAAIRAAPDDEALRLVYADWLEERGDPRAEYLRLVAELAARAGSQRPSAELRARLRDLSETIGRDWREAVGGRFDLVLISVRPGQVVPTIAVLREMVGCGIPEAMRLVERPLPAVVLRGLLREDAEKRQEELEVGSHPLFRPARLPPGEKWCSVEIVRSGNRHTPVNRAEAAAAADRPRD